MPSPAAITAMRTLGLAVSASTLIVVVPSLLHRGAHVHLLALVSLVALSTALAASARYWRPHTQRRPSADAG